MPQAPVRRVGSHDRVFYGSIVVCMALMAIVGFAPTFYLRLFSGGPMATFGVGHPFTPLIYIHGALFTAWVGLFIVPALISAPRVAVHRRIGVGGAPLAAAMIAVATMTALAAAKRGPGPAGIPSLAFLAMPLFDMLMFTTFITAALALRRNKEAHKRLMLLGSVSIMGHRPRACRARCRSGRSRFMASRSYSLPQGSPTISSRGGASTPPISGGAPCWSRRSRCAWRSQARRRGRHSPRR